MRPGTTLLLIFYSLLVTAAGRAASVEPQVLLQLSPVEATVGDRLEARLSVRLPADASLDPDVIGPRLGPFAVDAEGWSGPIPEGEGQRWTWSGSLVSFRTGELEVPPVRIEFLRGDGSSGSAESAAVGVLVRSVLDPRNTEEGESTALADLKPPASLEPDYSGLWAATALLALLLALAGIAWWLQRRFAVKSARIQMPQDPFHRVPPHVWAYEALQALLDRHLVEQGQFDTFFMELSRIAKLYLGGRYRVDLMERTSGEVPGVLEQARTPGPTIEGTSDLLGLADRVKFAGERPDPENCRRAIDSVYEIVDATKPADEPQTVEERGAA